MRMHVLEGLFIILLVVLVCESSKEGDAGKFNSNINDYRFGQTGGRKRVSGLRGGTDQDGSRLVITANGAYRIPVEPESEDKGKNSANGKSYAMSLAKLPKHIAAVETPFYEAKLIRTWPHDAAAFTEGLGFSDFPNLYESTGLYSNLTFQESLSSIRLVDYRTGQIKLHRELDHRIFAEGSLVLGGVLYVFCYDSNVVRVFDSKTLEPFPIPKRIRSINAGPDNELSANQLSLPPEGPLQGWGATTDGQRIIISDGTSNLHFLDGNLQHLDTIVVRDGEDLVRDLNELEWVDGLIYANILGVNCIAKILPETGDIVGWIHVPVDKLWPENPNPLSNVLNGIAYDASRKVLLITGKLWPRMFQVEMGGRLPKNHGLKDVCRSIRKIDYVHTKLQGGWKDFLVQMPKVGS